MVIKIKVCEEFYSQYWYTSILAAIIIAWYTQYSITVNLALITIKVMLSVQTQLQFLFYLKEEDNGVMATDIKI